MSFRSDTFYLYQLRPKTDNHLLENCIYVTSLFDQKIFSAGNSVIFIAFL